MITDNIQKGGGGGGSSIPLPVSIPNGGTGATTKEDARTNLGLGSLATKDSISSSEVSGLGTAATKAYTTSVTNGSSSLVTSGAVYTAVSGKMDAISGTVGGSSQPVYISNGSFVAANSYPTVYSATTSYTSTSTVYPAAASLLKGRIERTIAPIETGTTASAARARGDFFIDNSGYLRVASSTISSGSAYSNKSIAINIGTILNNFIKWRNFVLVSTRSWASKTTISIPANNPHIDGYQSIVFPYSSPQNWLTIGIGIGDDGVYYVTVTNDYTSNLTASIEANVAYIKEDYEFLRT